MFSPFDQLGIYYVDTLILVSGPLVRSERIHTMDEHIEKGRKKVKFSLQCKDLRATSESLNVNNPI